MLPQQPIAAADHASRQFDELYRTYRLKFVRFAASYLRDEMAAEDIVMDSFVSYWEHRDSIRQELSPPAYILTSVRNRCINYLKSQQVRNRVQSHLSDVGTRLLQTQITSLNACDPRELFSEETRDILSRAIAELPTLTRDIFVRSRIGEQSYKEIMAEMDISFRTVDYELRKATRLLSEKLRRHLPDLLPALLIFFIE